MPAPLPPPDRELQSALLERRAGAAGELIERHLDALYAFVHFRLGARREEVEEVVQETFTAALAGVGAFDGRSSLYTWLCGIAKNKIRASRARGRSRSLEQALEESDPEIDSILAEVAREPLPLEVLERKETRELVGATLSSLPSEYREALLSKYVEGLSTGELALRTRKSAKAAESTLTRARVAFARVFELLAKRRGGLEE
ncbi:MAG: sigma-70 family RNA polymerase sigma factor [Planctomycetes bacterium]|nr:sigma-70 family RNA polymerase sigma factor [Planctomycetota bacterium]